MWEDRQIMYLCSLLLASALPARFAAQEITWWSSRLGCCNLTVGFDGIQPNPESPMTTAEPNTDELLNRAAAGDASARAHLLSRHRQKLRNLIALRLDPRLAARF